MTQRKQTLLDHQMRINESLYRIHADLSRELSVADLAGRACYSPFHYQRIFRQVTGESVHDYIRRCRLEWAANLLIYNPSEAVMDIAAECGFRSNASFCHAFKATFGYSPSAWRREGFVSRSRSLKSGWSAASDNPHQRYHRQTLDPGTGFSPHPVKVRRLPDQVVAYIRHLGYDRGIGEVWERLLDWAIDRGIDPNQQQMIGLHHSNPDLIPFDQCRYVACLTLPSVRYPESGVGVMIIPGGLHACCEAEGEFGDLLYVMRDLHMDWLPKSDYRARSIPPHACYRENHFINASGRFRLEYRVPIARRLAPGVSA